MIAKNNKIFIITPSFAGGGAEYIAITIAKDTGIKAAVLDPLGAELEPGKDLYFELISDMASSFENCYIISKAFVLEL